MKDEQWTEGGELVTALILDVFRLNGQLVLAGDRLVEKLGLTSARWQVLGAIANAERAESVAWHARTMGVHRQGVQRIVNDLRKEDIVEFQPNPHHKRAQLVVLTSKGQKLYEEAMSLQTPWVNSLSDGLSSKDISTAKSIIEHLKKSLEETALEKD